MSSQLAGESGSLSGVRVVEIADELGEYCGRLLAGLGAEVIKVEPVGGESARDIGPFCEGVEDPGRSLYFWQYSLGKRSCAIDGSIERLPSELFDSNISSTFWPRVRTWSGTSTLWAGTR